jgi:hypothetical protein
MPAIPLYEGTRPYEAVPFPWSLHTATSDGVPQHRALIAVDIDPRRRFAETLIEAQRPYCTNR